MIVIIKTCLRFFAAGLFVFLSACGLPNPASQNAILYKPIISGYSDGSSLFLTFKGNYQAEKHPNFEGFNVYFGFNNETDQIAKRIIYSSFEDSLPSKTAAASQTLSVELRLAGRISYRFTEKATALDLSDARITSRSEPLTEPIASKKYYFYVKAVQDGKESSASSVLLLPVYQVSRRTVNWGEAIAFNEMQLRFDRLSAATGELRLVNDKVAVQPAPAPPPPAQLLTAQYYAFPSSGYTKTTYPFREKEGFFLSYQDGDNKLSYLKIFIESLSSTTLEVSAAYFNCITKPCF